MKVHDKFHADSDYDLGENTVMMLKVVVITSIYKSCGAVVSNEKTVTVKTL